MTCTPTFISFVTCINFCMFRKLGLGQIIVFACTFTCSSIAGRKAILEIMLAETPDSLIFLKDHESILEKQDKRISVRSREEHKIWYLEIDDVKEADSGFYTAVATNSKGKSTCSTRIFVNKR